MNTVFVIVKEWQAPFDKDVIAVYVDEAAAKRAVAFLTAGTRGGYSIETASFFGEDVAPGA